MSQFPPVVVMKVKCKMSSVLAGPEQVVTFRLETNGTGVLPSLPPSTITALHSLTCIVRRENTSPSLEENILLHLTDRFRSQQTTQLVVVKII